MMRESALAVLVGVLIVVGCAVPGSYGTPEWQADLRREQEEARRALASEGYDVSPHSDPSAQASGLTSTHAFALTFGRQRYQCGEVSSYIGEGGQGVMRRLDYPPDVSQAVVRVLQRRGIPVQIGLISTGDIPLGKSINSWLQCLGRFNEFTGTATGENYDRTFLQLSVSVSGDGPHASSVIAAAALRGERDVNPGAGLMIPHGNERIVPKPSNGTAEAELFLLLEDELRATPPPQAATTSVRGNASGSTIDRLRELEQMRKEKLITESEFKAKRRKLIEEQ